ncbi:MAG: fibro-slime domain-containing protein [Phycisphaerales bacterium]|jgi:fibro-slime domain-containing protein|nr:fibro-slime domain-containing protein [Phycisphaerales bacterium]
MRLMIPITVATLFTTVFAVTTPPETIELTGTVRDFKERSVCGGHPDFEVYPSRGFAQYCKNIAEQLGSDGLPVFTGNGRKVKWQCSDSNWNPICWTLYDCSLGDHNIVFRGPSTGGIQSASSFNQWFRDVEGVNISIPLAITLVRQSDGSYVFDDSEDQLYQSLGGFFPIENQGWGNPGGSPDRNFHFTFELHTEFTYDENGAQYFSFLGDDDVWVFINGQLVIDLGGVHGATEQGVDLTRLNLEDGETYALDFFFAERHRTQSNFRFQTNLQLETASLPTGEDSYD